LVARVVVLFWPLSDAQVPRLNAHYAHIANVQHADPTGRNAVEATTQSPHDEHSFRAGHGP
jgi:hypothetical protein